MVAWKNGHTSRLNKLTNLRFNLKSKINYHELISHDTNKHHISFLIIWVNIKIIQTREDICWKLKGRRKNMGMTFGSMHVIWIIDCINKVTHLKFSLNSKTFMHLYWHDNWTNTILVFNHMNWQSNNRKQMRCFFNFSLDPFFLLIFLLFFFFIFIFLFSWFEI